MRVTIPAGDDKGVSLLLVLALLGLAAPIAMALALVWLQSQSADRLVHEEEGKLLAHQAVELAERLRAVAEPSEQDLMFVSGLAKADVLASEDTDRVERFLFERARTRSWIRSVFLFVERGGRMILVSPHANGRSWQAMRQRFDYDATTELRELDDNFNLIHRELRSTAEFNPRQRPWYEIVSQDGLPTWTRPYRLYPSGLAGITVVAPLLGPDGVRTGVVGATVRLRELDRLLRTLAGKGEAGFAVIERDGSVIASSAAARTNAEGADEPAMTGVAGNPTLVLAAAAAQQLVRDGRSYTRASANGERYLIGVAPLSPRADAALALVHAPAGSTLRVFVANERALVASIAAGFVLAATMSTFLIWGWVAKPLAAARRFAVAQGKAEPPPHLAPGPLVELRQLGQGLLAMSEEIAERRSQEAELRASLASGHSRMEALLAGAPLAVVELQCVASNHHVARWQGRSAKLFGHEATEVEGNDLASTGVIPATAVGALDDLVRRCLETGWAEATLPFLTKAQDYRMGQWYASRVSADANAATILLLVHDETERAAAFATIDRLAREDALTGLANRRRFLDLLEQALGQAGRRHEGLAIWALDLDDLKGINDAYGHSDGDEVLREIAGRLRHLVRSSDAVARFGGDEFMLMQTEVGDPLQVDAFGRRLRDILERPLIVAQRSLAVTCGVGVALFPADGTVASDLLRRADLALLAAKVSGRGQLRRFQPDLEAAIAGRRALEERLRRAIREDKLELAYQPIWNIASTLRMVAAEALARWTDDGVPMSPAVFVPLAEESDLIHELGELVVKLGAQQLQRWAQEGFALPVSVNLSPAQLRRAGFADRLMATMEDTGAARDLLHLEVTESLFLESAEAVLQLRRLQDTGFALAIDDFGTGYANLASLVRLRPRWLKIDRSFISGMTTDPRSMTITRAVVDLARSLNMDAVAEGVETEAQLEVLRAIGCPLAQGFLLGRPSPPDALRDADLGL